MRPCRARVALRPLRPRSACRPLIALRPLRPRRALVALRPLRPRGAGSSRVALRPLRPRRARVALCACRTFVALVAFMSHSYQHAVRHRGCEVHLFRLGHLVVSRSLWHTLLPDKNERSTAMYVVQQAVTSVAIFFQRIAQVIIHGQGIESNNDKYTIIVCVCIIRCKVCSQNSSKRWCSVCIIRLSENNRRRHAATQEVDGMPSRYRCDQVLPVEGDA